MFSLLECAHELLCSYFVLDSQFCFRCCRIILHIIIIKRLPHTFHLFSTFFIKPKSCKSFFRREMVDAIAVEFMHAAATKLKHKFFFFFTSVGFLHNHARNHGTTYIYEHTLLYVLTKRWHIALSHSTVGGAWRCFIVRFARCGATSN